MTDYRKIKDELIRRKEKTTHFTKQFLSDYIECVKSRKYTLENDIDDSYKIGNVTYYHSWDKVYNSKFYQKNSCGYCVFLEIVNI